MKAKEHTLSLYYVVGKYVSKNVQIENFGGFFENLFGGYQQCLFTLYQLPPGVF